MERLEELGGKKGVSLGFLVNKLGEGLSQGPIAA